MFTWNGLDNLHEFFQGDKPSSVQLSLLSRDVLKQNLRACYCNVKDIDKRKVGELVEIIRQFWDKLEKQRARCLKGEKMIGDYIMLDNSVESDPTMEIFVKTLTGLKVSVLVKDGDTIDMNDFVNLNIDIDDSGFIDEVVSEQPPAAEQHEEEVHTQTNTQSNNQALKHKGHGSAGARERAQCEGGGRVLADHGHGFYRCHGNHQLQRIGGG